MKLFGFQLFARAPKAPAPQQQSATGPRMTAPAVTDFGWYGTKLTPAQVRSLLTGMRAGSFTDGYDLFSEMQDTWHTLAKNLQQLREAVATVRYQVQPATIDGQAPSADALAKAATCRQAMQAFFPDPAADENNFEDFIYDLTDALVLGVNVQEILWDHQGDAILPRATCWVHPNQYGLGNDGRLGLSSASQPSSLISHPLSVVSPFTPDKFIIASYKTRSGARTVGGLLRPLAWWWCAVQFGRDWVLRNAELFGQPIRDIEFDPNIKPDDLAELKSMAANMGSSAWITRPSGTKLNLIEASKTGDASPQAELLDRADRACDLMILWQTLTSQTGPSGGGSLALGEVHMGVLESRKQNIARWAANVVSYQLFPAICRLNHGDADECPVLAPDHTKAEDPKAKAERLAVVKSIVPLPKTWAYEQLGVPMPAEGEDTIAQTQPAAPAPAPVPPGTWSVPMRAADTAPERAAEDLRKTASVALIAARANDLKPIADRLALIDALQDDAQFEAELKALLADLPILLKQISKSDATAQALAQAMAAEFFNGLAAKPARQAPLKAFNENHDGDGRFAEGDGGSGAGGGGQENGGDAGHGMSEGQIRANLQRGGNAMHEVIAEQKDITAAMTRADVGDIDFVWSRDGRGIKHIIERRTAEMKARPGPFALSAEETTQRLVEVIARGKATPKRGQWSIEHEGYQVLLAQASGKRNAWLITGFQLLPRDKGGRR